uniref:Uncharacterized protein n=1 Tax=Arundo donax TaxID=35708 RepID=A0A0A9EVJ3_ARUDO
MDTKGSLCGVALLCTEIAIVVVAPAPHGRHSSLHLTADCVGRRCINVVSKIVELSLVWCFLELRWLILVT